LFIRAADCDEGALGTLQRECRELDLQDVVEILGDGDEEHFGALRAARLAVALGQPFTGVRAAVDPLWFDLPVVAFDDPISREVVEPCGLILVNRSPLDVAAVIKAVAQDDNLRRVMIAEGRRVRARYAPETVAGTLLEALGSADVSVTHNRIPRLG
jgi:glycosyltransferase involved in cell wall biosynthesis